MIDDDQLFAFAYHAEKVASRRLANQKSLSIEQALREILAMVAGSTDLRQLIASRQAKRQADTARLAAKRQSKLNERLAKMKRSQAPPDAWQAWFDGSAKPNPGRCGIGAVLRGPSGEYVEICQTIGYGDSSDAEYRSLIALLNKALQVNAVPLVIYGDSQVVINDVIGGDAPAALCLAEYRCQVLALLSQLGGASLHWVPRHKNRDADALSQRAVVAAMSEIECGDE